jgi:hypothetical protein
VSHVEGQGSHRHRIDQRHWAPLVEKRQISDMAEEKRVSRQKATKELLAEKQPSLDFVSPGSAWRHRGLSLFARMLGVGKCKPASCLTEKVS